MSLRVSTRELSERKYPGLLKVLDISVLPENSHAARLRVGGVSVHMSEHSWAREHYTISRVL